MAQRCQIDLSTTLRQCEITPVENSKQKTGIEDTYQNQRSIVSKMNPLSFGVESDDSSEEIKFTFTNIPEQIKGTMCMVQIEAANGNKSIQEITAANISGATMDGNEIQTFPEKGNIVINWKPNSSIMQEKGLAKFSFMFYKLNENGEYEYALNTSPIYGNVYESVKAIQGIGSNIYPSEIADLYSKYNSLLKDGDIKDLDSFEDVKLYLQTLVPFNIGAETPTSEVPNNASKNQWHVLAYNPGQKRYGYVPAVMLDKEVIYGQIWNAGEYEGVELKDLPTPPPIHDATWPSSN